MGKYSVTENGYYGEYGGIFIPEILQKNIQELIEVYKKYLSDASFLKEFKCILRDYVGRPTPLYHCEYLSNKYKKNIFLKREDLCHTGAHKINNTVGQVLLAEKLGKKEIVAETGAGQHGLATATVCALRGMKCLIFMGETDVKRQQPNVEKIKMLGADVVPVLSGTKTLKDATNEAMRYWIKEPQKTHYIIGSVVGPHPYPDMVAKFQAIISEEIRAQLLEQTGSESPDYVLACVGGGSNAIGAFFHFLENEKVQLFGAEAAGYGIDTNKTAATLTLGTKGVLHGSKSYVIQDKYGQIVEPHSISAGLDYPGIGPIHSYLKDVKRVSYIPISDDEALSSGKELARKTGIIPALESSHALALLDKIQFEKNSSTIVINLSGRGDKDMEAYINKNKV